MVAVVETVAVDLVSLNTTVQFNYGGAFAGSAKFTYNNCTNTLTVAGLVVANTVVWCRYL
jgi:hypothetical protein